MIHIKKKGWGAIFVFWGAEGKACWGCQSWGQKLFQNFLGGGKQGRGTGGRGLGLRTTLTSTAA